MKTIGDLKEGDVLYYFSTANGKFRIEECRIAHLLKKEISSEITVEFPSEENRTKLVRLYATCVNKASTIGNYFVNKDEAYTHLRDEVKSEIKKKLSMRRETLKLINNNINDLRNTLRSYK